MSLTELFFEDGKIWAKILKTSLRSVKCDFLKNFFCNIYDWGDAVDIEIWKGEMTCTFLVIVAYLGDLVAHKYFPAGKKEKAIDTCNNIECSQGQYAKKKKSE